MIDHEQQKLQKNFAGKPSRRWLFDAGVDQQKTVDPQSETVLQGLLRGKTSARVVRECCKERL